MAQKKVTLDDALRMVQEILTDDRKDLRSLLYRDIILNALSCKSEELDILDLKVINRAVAEFMHAACVFKPYRAVRKVSIFGSARVAVKSPYYQLAVKLGRLIAESGFMVITGAAEGIMRAGIEGAGAQNSFGINILLPFEEGPKQDHPGRPQGGSFQVLFYPQNILCHGSGCHRAFPGGLRHPRRRV